MKIYTISQFPLLLRHAHVFTVGSLFCASLLVFSITQVSAQSNLSFTDIPQASIDGAPDVNWEAIKNYYIVVNTDLNSTETILSDPNLSAQQRVTYTAYYRMLTYIQTDLINKIPVENIVVDNFNKVKIEAQTDPKLANLEGVELNTLYTAFFQRFYQ